ncbi:MAG TPA: Tex family protein [Myxococcota bacterium]|nr:Tex family protein [Myxococcota bacterium]
MDIARRIADELEVGRGQVEATIGLLDGGATVPFVARYRKEATGGLDDVQLRRLEERLRYLRELEAERERVILSVTEQGKLTPELEAKLREAETLARLDDLYAPYRKKRRTLAQIAREAGLGPLADRLLDEPDVVPEEAAAAFVDAERGVADVDAALDGARHVLVERFAEDADLLADLRDLARATGRLVSKVVDGKQVEGARFRDWFDFGEAVASIPAHRILALLRGEREGALTVRVEIPAPEDGPSEGERRVARRFGIEDRGRPADRWRLLAVRVAWRGRISVGVETFLLGELRERAERQAIGVFASNLRDLLLAPPAGPRVTMGLDPGIRTGVKVAVVDATGKVVDTATVYPFAPRHDVAGARAALTRLLQVHGVELIAIGNGTAGRETDRLVAEVLDGWQGPRPARVTVHEAGASVYSASEVASEELPQLDVTLRGAVSIARRLQDPLAELVKIEPRSIGVGQYQHDVDGRDLARSLDGVVEDCVNAVGVDLNTASPSLLARVAGLGPSVARAIVAWRDEHGAFRQRRQLMDVPRLGPKTWEQCAGFLRIRGGDNPLDASAVHPEAYPVVERLLQRTGRPIHAVLGDAALLRSVDPRSLVDDRFGLPTVRDILAELDKPGRDPRPAFRSAAFQEGVEELKDLRPGMILEGAVTNVTDFGAFVDVGVHQDGLVHVSRLSERFVRDPREIVRAGQIVKVKVIEIDLDRKRVSLSMRLGDEPGAPKPREPRESRDGRGRPQRPPARPEPSMGSLGDLFRRR